MYKIIKPRVSYYNIKGCEFRDIFNDFGIIPKNNYVKLFKFKIEISREEIEKSSDPVGLKMLFNKHDKIVVEDCPGVHLPRHYNHGNIYNLYNLVDICKKGYHKVGKRRKHVVWFDTIKFKNDLLNSKIGIHHNVYINSIKFKDVINLFWK